MTNDQGPKNDQVPMSKASDSIAVPSVDNQSTPRYDLEERTAVFGEHVIDLVKLIRETAVTRRLIDQVVGAATSVGANYCEADESVSKKEFRLKIGICKKEAKETKFFLRMLARAVPDHCDAIRTLWLEAKSLHLIFCAIYRK